MHIYKTDKLNNIYHYSYFKMYIFSTYKIHFTYKKSTLKPCKPALYLTFRPTCPILKTQTKHTQQTYEYIQWHILHTYINIYFLQYAHAVKKMRVSAKHILLACLVQFFEKFFKQVYIQVFKTNSCLISCLSSIYLELFILQSFWTQLSKLYKCSMFLKYILKTHKEKSQRGIKSSGIIIAKEQSLLKNIIF